MITKVYIAYLVFQLFSHTNLYADTGDHIFKSTSYHADKKDKFARISKKFGKANPFHHSKEKATQPTAANEEGRVEEEEDEILRPEGRKTRNSRVPQSASDRSHGSPMLHLAGSDVPVADKLTAPDRLRSLIYRQRECSAWSAAAARVFRAFYSC